MLSHPGHRDWPVFPGLLVATICLACQRPAAAVVINAATAGTLNSTAPANDPGWNNVGFFGIGTAIYLGDRWGLTAYHNLGSPDLVLGDTSYALLPGSEVRVTNTNNVVADMMLFRLAADPGLPGLTIATTRPAHGSPLVVVGAGHRQLDGLTHWTSTWQVVDSGGTYAGYHSSGTHFKRWGTNTIEPTSSGSPDADLTINTGYGTVQTFHTHFDDIPGDPNECNAVFGDSGGAAFYNRAGAWNLAGMVVATGRFAGQASDDSVFGNQTYYVDMSVYRSQIAAIMIPEPAAPGLALAGLAGAATACAALRRGGRQVNFFRAKVPLHPRRSGHRRLDSDLRVAHSRPRLGTDRRRGAGGGERR